MIEYEAPGVTVTHAYMRARQWYRTMAPYGHGDKTFCSAETRVVIPLASTSLTKLSRCRKNVIVSCRVPGAEIGEMKSGRAPWSCRTQGAPV